MTWAVFVRKMTDGFDLQNDLVVANEIWNELLLQLSASRVSFICCCATNEML